MIKVFCLIWAEAGEQPCYFYSNYDRINGLMGYHVMIATFFNCAICYGSVVDRMSNSNGRRIVQDWQEAWKMMLSLFEKSIEGQLFCIVNAVPIKAEILIVKLIQCG